MIIYRKLLPCPDSVYIVHRANKEPRWWGYLSQWNLLDYPTFILPVTHVQLSDIKDPSYKPTNALDQETYELYDPNLFEGAPVAVQLIGRSMHEEQLLAVAMAVDQAVKA